MMHSPSKYTSLARLKQIRTDNYIGEGGKEYCCIEVEALIAEKEQKQAMEFVTKSMASRKAMANKSAVNDRLGMKDKVAEMADKLLSMGHRFLIMENIKIEATLPWERSC